MISQLSSGEAASVDRMNRDFINSGYGAPLSQFFNDFLAELASGNISISSDSADVDALCLGGGAFTYNESSSSGLTLAYNAGHYSNGYSHVAVSAGTLTLAASSTNYLELDRTLGVTANTSGWTAGRLALMVAVTGTSVINSVTNARDLLTLVGPRGVNGAMLSAVAATKSVEKSFASISATNEFTLLVPAGATITGITFTNSAAVSASDSNYWSLSAINKATGSGTAALLDTGADNTTKATGGSAIAAYSARSLVLTSTTGNLACNANDTLAFSFTMTGSPTTLTEVSVRIDFAFSN